jgi:hypothetical protein
MHTVCVSEIIVTYTYLHGVTHRKKVKYVILYYIHIFPLWLSGVFFQNFVLKILIFRQDLRISPSRISAPDMTAISLTVQVGARFRREGVALNQYSLCP